MIEEIYNKKQPIIDLLPVIQGEGMYAGIPHILIRLSGCNLRCQWKGNKCDTPYSSWNAETGDYNLNDVISTLTDIPYIEHIMITGGEPCLHKALLQELVELCHKFNYVVTIETNGSIDYFYTGADLISVSPKMSNSIPNIKEVGENSYSKHCEERINYATLSQYVHNYKYEGEKIQFKFVVEDIKDLDEIKQLQTELKIPREIIYLMPEGITSEEISNKRPMIFDMCIENGYNYTDRLHVLAYGNKRKA
ncbi:MAG: 7-carboxy-7-deazaguanine synthase QueE [Candidatus Omnitrophica bacterium]|jgi:organic radical activating enzyme|nr:7-carboxy-7-deazaguanine synthase QueE [Candidatus Omnitrophota bacterium]